MTQKTIQALRKVAWLDLALAGTALVLVLAAACLKSGYAAAPGAGRGLTQTAPPELLGMSVTAAPDSQTASAGAGAQVTISNFSFGPATVTVPAGTTVAFTNQDSITHTVTAADGSFDSSNLQPGAQFSYTFTTPGTYSYHCSIHPFMTGQVVVQ